MDETTRGLINRRTLGMMKPGSFLINTSRGGLVVEEDLCAALQSGQLAGAALDVFEVEPTLVTNPLLQLSILHAVRNEAGLTCWKLWVMRVASWGRCFVGMLSRQPSMAWRNSVKLS